jgi:hypothetical protein
MNYNRFPLLISKALTFLKANEAEVVVVAVSAVVVVSAAVVLVVSVCCSSNFVEINLTNDVHIC